MITMAALSLAEIIFSFEWGYSWHSHYTPAYKHHLKVLDLNFLHFAYINRELPQVDALDHTDS